MKYHIWTEGCQMRKSLLANVPREEFRRLYNGLLLTTEEIGKLYDVSAEVVRTTMNKLGIPRRGAPWSSIERRSQLDGDTLKKLYVMEGLSMAEISRRLGVSQTTVLTYLRKNNIDRRDLSTASIRYLRHNFSGDQFEKAYLTGFRQGDLWVKRTHDGPVSDSISVACTSSSLAQIILIERLFTSYGHISITPSRKDKYIQYSLQWCLDMTFDFLIPKEDFIPRWIVDDPRFFPAYLGGYVDAEGYFGLQTDGTSRFSLGSCDVTILHQIYEMLTGLFDIDCPAPRLSSPKGSITGGKYKSRRDYWSFSVGKTQSLYRLCELLEPFLKHETRRKQMLSVWNNVVARSIKKS